LTIEAFVNRPNALFNEVEWIGQQVIMEGTDIKRALGRNIKYFRFHKQITQASLAEKADISITFLSNIERGLKYPKAQILAQIASGLEVGVWELFKDEVTPVDSKELLDRLTSDLKSRVIEAMDEVIGQYRGD
jgi:transcriptional regulator with XRE-family HTH domain